MAAFDAEQAGRIASDPGQRVEQREAHFLAPFQGQGEQEFKPGGARFGFAEGDLLGIVIDRGVIGAEDIDRTAGQAGAQRVAVALAAQRRVQPGMRVEEADVMVAEVQVIDAHVAADVDALGAGGGDHRHRGRR